MSDFEVCPVGTVARLAQVEAERDSMREILDHIPQVEAELAETSDKLHAVEAERDALLVALKLIAATDPVDAALDPERAARIAYAAIAKAQGGSNG